MPNEICILCGKETTTDINTHVDFRTGYIEGAGQLCLECHLKGGPESRDMITIPKHYVTTYPNNFELGGKIRQYFYENYGTQLVDRYYDWSYFKLLKMVYPDYNWDKSKFKKIIHSLHRHCSLLFCKFIFISRFFESNFRY